MRNLPTAHFHGYSEAALAEIKARGYELLRLALGQTRLPISPRLRRLVEAREESEGEDEAEGAEEVEEMEAMQEVEDDGGFDGSDEEWD